MKLNLRLLTALIVVMSIFTQCSTKEEIQLAKPSEKQLRFADWEVGAFIHFGLNVFTGQEHGDGKEPPSKFNPTELDAEQWVLAAKALGAKYACLTVRHEGGFCLWPSKSTEYTIANSPYKNGKGDIARDFVDACRKHGMKIGFYHTSSHDAHQGLSWYDGEIEWGPQRDSLMHAGFKNIEGWQEKYVEVQMEQMRELLTNYGPIDFMWSDHWGAPGCEYIWKPITDLVAELQPNMVFMGPDTWIPGNETGHVVYPMWNAVNTVDGTKYTRPAPTEADTKIENNYGLLETDALAGHPLGKYWRPRECTTNTAFHTGGWFWHPDSVRPTHARPLTDHLNLYYRSVGLGANAIINLPPDNRGLIPDDIVAAAKSFGDEIKNRFASPIASLQDAKPNNTVVLEWPEAKEINTIVTMENIVNGQRVAKYAFDAFVDGEWVELMSANKLAARKPYNPNPGFETIGHKKIDRVTPIVTNKIRFRCLESVSGKAEIRSLAVYNCDPIDHQ